MKSKSHSDHYAAITNAIIAELENGVRPWTKSWVDTTPLCRPRRGCGESYRGINTLLLWLSAARRGFESPYWLTYRQAAELGGQVKRGEKGTTIVFFSTLEKPTEEIDEDTKEKIPFLKTYSVFNASQIDRLPDRFHPPVVRPEWPTFENVRNEAVDAFFENAGVRIEFGGDIPHYSPLYDRVQMPPFSAFRNANDFYAVLGHEAVHWVGHPSRLPRKFPIRSRGKQNYAREELIAEMGAAFLCSDLGLSVTPRPDHAQYLAHWIELLRHDKRTIFKAAATAQKSVDYLHSLQPANMIAVKQAVA